jgi:hypothetical protein
MQGFFMDYLITDRLLESLLFRRIGLEKLRDSGAKRREVFQTVFKRSLKNSSEKIDFLVRFVSRQNEQYLTATGSPPFNFKCFVSRQNEHNT